MGQQLSLVKGIVLDQHSKKPISEVSITLEGTGEYKKTDASGSFKLGVLEKGSYVISLTKNDYILQRIPVTFTNDVLNLGEIYLEKDIVTEQTDNLISLTESELFDDAINSNTTGLLQATRDVFLNTAAFDFGQAFFRVRGYDSQNGAILINGVSMNQLIDGRPQWNHWGGLNDVTRNQQFSSGLSTSDFTFGGILGATNIDTRPSKLRPGTRFSSSVSNRTYAGRLMATYTSKQTGSGISYSFSGSRRWGKRGYVDGTLYDAFSFFMGLEYRLSKKNSINMTAIMASNRRGRSSAITEEVYRLVGNRYNPYWGEQGDQIRNSRERKIAEPIILLNHFFESEKLSVTTGAAFQFGASTRSRLGYYNAPNPDPTYYRYLPSFYINSPIGANFESARQTREGFLADQQLNWERLYQANQQGRAGYLLYDDRVENKQLTLTTLGNWMIGKRLQATGGLTYKQLTSDNYAQINDLLGASFHIDSDPFSETANNLKNTTPKLEKDIFNYQYQMNITNYEGFAQLRYQRNKWDSFISGKWSAQEYQRDGFFQNERFVENSFGKSEMLNFTSLGIKGGFDFKITGRHWVAGNAAQIERAPLVQNSFVNPRESNQIVPNLQRERVSSIDLNYYLRLPRITGRLSAFHTRFQNGTDINFFFVDAGVGSDFVQEVLTDVDKLHMGIELGMEYKLSSAVKVTAVAAMGEYLYASNPEVEINFDTSGNPEEVIDSKGNVSLGTALLKGYKLGQGPQKAFAIGVEYRDPKYWWLKATTNYLGNNFANISSITRTQSFYLNPDTGQSFPEATPENVEVLLRQKSLDEIYLLNLVGGKSWLKKGKYMSIFASINNVFDAVFRTGGYEQSRNGNFGQLQQDELSGTPSFAPKYWYGFGRTYFLNIAYSF